MPDVPNPHDALFRWTFSHLEDARALLKSQLPRSIAARVDWPSLEIVSGSFVDEALQGRQADLLFATRLGGAEALLYVLLEHQSAPDVWMAFRLVRYQVRIWERWLRDNPGARRLPMILPIVLYHGARAWPAPTELTDLFEVPGGLAQDLAPHLLAQRFLLDDISDVTDEALTGRALTGFADLTLRALSRARALPPEGIALELARWLKLARTVARAPSGLHKLRALLQYLVEVSEVDEPTLAGFSQAITAPEEDEPMPTLAEKWTAEGLERGRAEGRAEGRADVVLRQLRVKFGDLPAEIVERVHAASPEQIDGWSEALLTAPTLAALFDG